jgi:3-deoxy-manno-octulosonate cytidylyltransferase (CMP-KDO synthetase)
MGSERFPGKPLAKIRQGPGRASKTMVTMVYDAVVDCPWIDGVCLALEGWKQPELRRGCLTMPTISTHRHPTGSDRVYEASRRMGITRGVILNIQGDEPLITHGHIKTLVDLFDDPTVQVGTLVRKLDYDEAKSEDVVKVQFDGTMRIFKFSRVMPEPGNYYGSVGIMGFRAGALAEFARMGQSKWEKHENIELQRCIDNNMPVHCAVTDVATIGVDRPDDIAKVEAVLEEERCRDSS